MVTDVKEKGDRKGPHPSASSTPASTMNGLGSRVVVLVEAGEEGRPGGDPCGRLPTYHSPILLLSEAEDYAWPTSLGPVGVSPVVGVSVWVELEPDS